MLVRTMASIKGRLRKAKEKIRLVFFSPNPNEACIGMPDAPQQLQRVNANQKSK
jgi:hypothetical protein